jgi:cytidylate kinase
MAIITISREMGSAGIPIVHKAAEKLGYTLVDGEAIKKVAPDYGLTPEAVEKVDEKPPAFVDTVDAQTEADYHQIELIIHYLRPRGSGSPQGGQQRVAGQDHRPLRRAG